MQRSRSISLQHLDYGRSVKIKTWEDCAAVATLVAGRNINSVATIEATEPQVSESSNLKVLISLHQYIRSGCWSICIIVVRRFWRLFQSALETPGAKNQWKIFEQS